MSLIKSNNVSFGYEGKSILSNLSFEVNSGDYLCIVGENGAGKSTLMKTILGLLPPVDGNISFDDGLLQKEIGYLPQQTVVQKDFPATVKEIVLSGFQGSCGLRPFYNKEEKKKAELNIERMSLNDLSKRCYRDLSGGQQQRVLLARALCSTKKLLLLDEPVSGLDPKVTTEMYELIKSLNRDDKITIMMISHDIISSLDCATHVLHVGQKTFFGTKDDYLKSDIGKRYLTFIGGYDVE